MINERCKTCGELPGIEFLQAWMRAENPMFGGVSSLYMLKMGKGDKVAAFIEQAYQAGPSPSEPYGYYTDEELAAYRRKHGGNTNPPPPKGERPPPPPAPPKPGDRLMGARGTKPSIAALAEAYLRALDVAREASARAGGMGFNMHAQDVHEAEQALRDALRI